MTGLDHELHADFDHLRAARETMDERIVDWAASLTDESCVEIDGTVVAFAQLEPAAARSRLERGPLGRSSSVCSRRAARPAFDLLS